MTTRPTHSCDEVRMAALAALDGERAGLTSHDVEAHLADCVSCRTALAGLATLHADLGRVDYERLDVDLWPVLERRVAVDVPHRAGRGDSTRREVGAILGLTVVLVAWRLAQLLLDLPAPVVNSVVPLALVVFVLRWLTGDPFAIRLSSLELQQKGAP
ncbi:MAG TPA: zf-HC2 domain-containing protein [Gemmatimonadaceae bacterium]|nr:zf-HC2 domain-containing protein [Gemmatimonadaceae bacterium]